jgi:hypothetical protein
LVPNFVWYDAKGNVIGNTKDQIVCPQKEENYKVDIIYTTCNGDTTTYSDDINLKFTVDYPTVQPYTKIICNVTDNITLADYKQFLTTNNFSNFNFEFVDASGLVVDENTPFTISADRAFNVTVSNKNFPDCKKQRLFYSSFIQTIF